MGTHRLVPHPDHPPSRVRGVEVQWIADAAALRLRYRVDGHETLIVPPFAGCRRADELWRTTCFELFLQAEGAPGYAELNFSPSCRWAAYEFGDYREGRRDLPLDGPACEMLAGERYLVLDVKVSAEGLPPPPWSVGLSAVLEEEGGTKSFWALAHAAGRPDFHHPTCFALALEPPAAA